MIFVRELGAIGAACLGSRGVLLGLALAVGGCSGGRASPAASPAAAKTVTMTQLSVASTEKTNGGNVLRMMVRSVAEKTADTTSESYEDAARMLGPPRDDAVLLSEPIFPGRPTRVRLAQEQGRRLIVYFFFTNPGDYWRVQVAGVPPAEVNVELGENQIERYRVRR